MLKSHVRELVFWNESGVDTGFGAGTGKAAERKEDVWAYEATFRYEGFKELPIALMNRRGRV